MGCEWVGVVDCGLFGVNDWFVVFGGVDVFI